MVKRLTNKQLRKYEKEQWELFKPIFWFAIGALFMGVICIIIAYKHGF